jgi:hypothetical protein
MATDRQFSGLGWAGDREADSALPTVVRLNRRIGCTPTGAASRCTDETLSRGYLPSIRCRFTRSAHFFESRHRIFIRPVRQTTQGKRAGGKCNGTCAHEIAPEEESTSQGRR